MRDYNTNDYKLLYILKPKKIEDMKNGLIGSTLNELSDKSGLSITTVRNTIKRFIREGYVEAGIKKVRANTYRITPLGVSALLQVQRGINTGGISNE